MAMIALSGLLGLPGVTLVNQVTDLETQTVTLQLAHEFDYAVCPGGRRCAEGAIAPRMWPYFQ